jgi:hypothetical protein
MTVTMTMAEYENLKQEAENKNYENLVQIAKSLLKHSNAYTVRNDCYNFVLWLAEENTDAMIGQFGMLERDA